ncbi:hypothetical protein [Caproicibacterium sp. BJN0003]|uniref:hypothetical protein n=1 Tax=Caproicibacterium sp. BJN0003 TaxID=2994078 RepID=UPI00225B4D41|nr:hypothetical protein [Caproicibacterium sp. BJN0003]UZT82155.1 hypothetical protein OP489_11915 [Caproicibacterium sp. BJN0003]
MKILDESGNPITGTPDFSTGRYLQNSDGDLVFTKYTDAELAEIKKQQESDPEYRISSLETLVLQLGGII